MPAHSKLKQLSDSVFGNDLLLEEILNFVIFNGTKVDYAAVRKFCFVCRSWRQTISNCLRISRKPLFYLTFHDNFEEWVSRYDKFPPVAVSVGYDVIPDYEYNVLWFEEDLSKLYPGLVDLFIEIPEQGFDNPVESNSIHLPILRRLTIGIYRTYKYNQGSTLDETKAYGGNSNVSSFIQLLLSGSPELKNLRVSGDYENDDPVPLGFEDLQLPVTLTEIIVDRQLKTKHLKIIDESHLPNLKTLKICITDTIFQNVFLQILGKFAKTLKMLSITGTYSCDLHLPHMKSLETLQLYVDKVGLPNDSLPCPRELKYTLPALKTIKFAIFKQGAFRNWTQKYRYGTVETLFIEVLRGNIRTLSLITSMLAEAFSHVITLHLTFNYSLGVSGLRNVFTNMKQLKEFRINLHDTTMDKWNADKWNSILLGITQKKAKILRKQRRNWGEMTCRATLPSIMDLTELRHLSLSLLFTYEEARLVLLCNVVFQFGFFTMPNLQEVGLEGGFKVTNDILQKWTENGRILKTMNITDRCYYPYSFP